MERAIQLEFSGIKYDVLAMPMKLDNVPAVVMYTINNFLGYENYDSLVRKNPLSTPNGDFEDVNVWVRKEKDTLVITQYPLEDEHQETDQEKDTRLNETIVNLLVSYSIRGWRCLKPKEF